MHALLTKAAGSRQLLLPIEKPGRLENEAKIHDLGGIIT
ncbi:hypothetical protein CHCC20335_1560 [Bacillus paralicheniformis]|nr:hypothetical protein CHCC20335_1560 [Bacillus paralicheniformis]